MPEPTPQDTKELVERAVELSNAVRDFQKSLGIVNVVENLDERTGTVEKLGKKTRFWQKVTICGLIFDLCLSIFGIALFYRVDSTTEKVNHVQRVVNQEVLCPIYTLVLSAGFHPELHKNDLAAYTATYKVIQEGAKKLECKNPVPTSPAIATGK